MFGIRLLKLHSPAPYKGKEGNGNHELRWFSYIQFVAHGYDTKITQLAIYKVDIYMYLSIMISNKIYYRTKQ